jgi:hypothetical protein
MWLVGLACAGCTLAISATCDPLTGTANFFRDIGHYDDGYYVEYYDDCFFDCW